MKETLSSLAETIILYNNNSFLIALFMIALVLLYITEKDKSVRLIFAYFITTVTIIFVCPLYAWLGMQIDSDIYYRVFWTLPVGVLVCYGAVRVFGRFQRTISKVLVVMLTVIVICVNGKFVYTNTLHFRATNAYHIPQVVIDVMDSLKLEIVTPTAAIPAELLPFIRQYSADVYTPYGRNIVETQWNFSNELYDAMEAETYNAEEIARCAKAEGCTFVVLSSIKSIEGSMEEQNYFLKDFVGGYYIYMDYGFYEAYLDYGWIDEIEPYVME